MADDKDRSLRLRAHRILPMSATRTSMLGASALGASLIASGGATAQVVATDDAFVLYQTRGEQFPGNVLANDTGATQVFSTTANGPGDTVVELSADGTVRVFSDSALCGATPPEPLQYTATDGITTDNAIVQFQLTSPVVPDAYQTNADTSFAGNVLDNDPDFNAIVVLNFSQPVYGTLVPTPGPTTAEETGRFTYTPSPGFSGQDNFDYLVSTSCDNAVASATVLVLPVAADDFFDTPFETAVCGLDLLANDTGNSVALVSVQPADVGTATIGAGGEVCYTPPAGFTGIATFGYTARDDFGSNTSATVQVAVGNGAPIVVDDFATTVVGVAASGNVLANDQDPDGNVLTVVSFTQPAFGTSSVDPDGDFTYQPNPGVSGIDSFDYFVRDDEGANAVATVNVTVAPVAGDDSYATPFGTALCGPNVLANDLGTGLAVASNTAPASGTVTIAANGDLCYTPATGFSGTASFGYSVRDAAGSNATATVQVVVGNGAPVAVADSATTVVDASASGNVLTNDSDPNGDPLSVVGNTQPGFGTATVAANGAFTYQPNAGTSGIDTFAYTVSDGQGGNASATVSITVAPIATDDAYTTAFQTATSGNVLANDRGTNLSASVTVSPSSGTLSLQPNGSFTYTPTAGFTGVDTFTYRVADGAGTQDTAVATITVGVAPVVISASGGSGQTAPIGTPFGAPLSVLVQQGGQPVAGARVCFAAQAGTLSAPEAVTNASGIASVTATAPTTLGGYTVTATLCDSPGVGSVTFNLVALLQSAVAVPVNTPAWLAALAGLLALFGWRRKRTE